MTDDETIIEWGVLIKQFSKISETESIEQHWVKRDEAEKKIKLARASEREKLKTLMELRTIVRINGLMVDIETQMNKDYYQGAKEEMQMLLRHLEDFKYILADIQCGAKYLTSEEKDKLKALEVE